MRKKRFILIGVQLCALVAFAFMAWGSGSAAPAVKGSQRVDRAACGNPDFVFLGTFDNQSSCSQACKSAGFTTSCMTDNNCYCK